MAKIQRKHLPVFIEKANSQQLNQIIDVFIAAINDVHEIASAGTVDIKDVLASIDEIKKSGAETVDHVSDLQEFTQINRDLISAVHGAESQKFGVSTEQMNELKDLFQDGVNENSSKIATATQERIDMMNDTLPVGEVKSFTDNTQANDWITKMNEKYGQTWQLLNIQDGFTLVADSIGGGTTNGENKSHSHSINHDHPSSTTSSNGSHSHVNGFGFISNSSYYKYGVTDIPNTPNSLAGSSTDGTHSPNTSTVSSHTHSFNVPNYSGTSGSEGGDNNLAAGIKVIFVERIN